MLPLTLSLDAVMSEPRDRPEVPPIVVDDLQIARCPILPHNPLIPVLEQDSVALVRHKIRVTAPFEQFFDTVQMVSVLTAPSPPSLFANTGQDRGPVAFRSARAASRFKRSRRQLHFTPAKERELGREGITRRQAQALHLRKKAR
jgi:hypothetical protein